MVGVAASVGVFFISIVLVFLVFGLIGLVIMLSVLIFKLLR